MKRTLYVCVTSLLLTFNATVQAAPIEYQKKYANVVVVAKSGGDFTDPITAINSISNASVSNPYVLKIMPGNYDLGSATLFMKEYVDIEGAGENMTTISSSVEYDGTVKGASNSEIRNLSVTNAGTGSSQTAITSDASVDLDHVTLSASGGLNSFGFYGLSGIMRYVTATATGVSSSMGVVNRWSSGRMENVTATAYGGSYGAYGVYNYAGASQVMKNVTAMASGGMNVSFGVYNKECSSITMSDVTATASGGPSYGVFNESSSVFVDHSAFEGTTGSIGNIGNTTLKIGASKLVGVFSGSGTCVSSYNGNYEPIDAACQ